MESNDLFKVCHLCHLLECEPNGVYICRHFEKRFDFMPGDESPIAHINIMMKVIISFIKQLLIATTTTTTTTMVEKT